MTTFTKKHSGFFYGALAAVATIGPILLIIAASAMPEGLEKGEFIVYGHGVVLAILSIAMALRAAYVVVFSNALKIAASEANSSVTAGV